MSKRFFASDNSAGVHPAVLDALLAANDGHAIAYGDDPWTRRAEDVFRGIFGKDSEVYFVYNGTGANVVGMQAALASYNAVICSDVSHIHFDECGAAENHIGCKLLTVPAPDGRITPDQILKFLPLRGEVHHTQPALVSITQATEYGTVYDPAEVRAIAELCHENGMYLHMDGARLCNAAARLETSLAGLTGDLGVDLLSLGGTKNGVMFGEAVVVFNPALTDRLGFVRKQGMQLASKMRYISAQFAALFEGEIWKENAAHANAMADLLAERLKQIPEVEIVQPVEANGLFVRLPADSIEKIQNDFFFYVWDAESSIVRFMLSFDSTESDVDAFVQSIKRHVTTIGD